MVFEVGLIEAVRYVSFTANGVFAFIWGKKKVILNHFLSGMWKGHLVDIKDPNFFINCTLYIDYQKNTCQGSLVYETKCNSEIYARGVDKLIQYEDKEFFPKEWNPIFERIFHIQESTTEIFHNNETYNFNCLIKERWLKDRMHVSLEGENRTLTGIWHRQ